MHRRLILLVVGGVLCVGVALIAPRRNAINPLPMQAAESSPPKDNTAAQRHTPVLAQTDAPFYHPVHGQRSSSLGPALEPEAQMALPNPSEPVQPIDIGKPRMVTDDDWYYGGPEVLIGDLLDADCPEEAAGPAFADDLRIIGKPIDANGPLEIMATDVPVEISNIGELRGADPVAYVLSHVESTPD